MDFVFLFFLTKTAANLYFTLILVFLANCIAKNTPIFILPCHRKLWSPFSRKKIRSKVTRHSTAIQTTVMVRTKLAPL